MRQVGGLNHSRWECKYHVVFIPEYLRIPLKSATHSTRKLPPKPRQSSHLSERSDTGFCFTRFQLLASTGFSSSAWILPSD